MQPHFDNLPPFDHDFTVCSDPTEVHRVQKRIVEQMKGNGFSDRDIFAVRLAVEEALVNAMKHGNQLDRCKNVRICFQIESDTFCAYISDEGPGFNPGDVPDPTACENLERPCGRGLMLMRYYMDEVLFLGSGNHVLMRKRRSS